MKQTQPLAQILLSLAFVVPCAADTFVLKDGSKLEGRILREEGSNYVLEVQVTKSIKDEKVVPKADITEKVKEKLDLKAFEAIMSFVPTPDSLSTDDYNKRILAVNTFVNQYQNSTKASEAKAMLETLKKEAAIVAAGGFKVGGEFITAEQYQANAFEIDAKVMEGKIRDAAKKSEYLNALRLFADFEKSFKASGAYRELLPIVRQMIQSYRAQVAEAASTLAARTKERKAGLERMSAENRSTTSQALDEENALADANYKEDKAARIGWVRTHPFHKQSLDETLRFADTELRRLENPRSNADGDAAKAYRHAWTVIRETEEPKEVNTAINEARSSQLPNRYMAMLEDAAKAKFPDSVKQ